jgi:hypothetical protein
MRKMDRERELEGGAGHDGIYDLVALHDDTYEPTALRLLPPILIRRCGAGVVMV